MAGRVREIEGGRNGPLDATVRSHFYTSRDGLRLHVRRYGVPVVGRAPVLCLPGLTRNAKDFHHLAAYLASPGPEQRQVFAFDYRGRGRSQWDADWTNYSPLVEAHDVLDFMALSGLYGASIVGTSRGGIIALLMAVLRPRAIAALVLNDIGPVIESIGMVRIAGYVGRLPLPATWDEAAATVKQLNRAQFPAVSDAQWRQVAEAHYDDLAGVPGVGYDPALANTIGSASAGGKLPTLWPQFQALGQRPVLVLRGEHSDILSAATVKRMHELHPRLEAATVAGEGHAPLLMDKATQTLISRFIERAEQTPVTLETPVIKAVA